MAQSDSPIRERGRTADHGVRPLAFTSPLQETRGSESCGFEGPIKGPITGNFPD
jgi:hypothetical protein